MGFARTLHEIQRHANLLKFLAQYEAGLRRSHISSRSLPCRRNRVYLILARYGRPPYHSVRTKEHIAVAQPIGDGAAGQNVSFGHQLPEK